MEGQKAFFFLLCVVTVCVLALPRGVTCQVPDELDPSLSDPVWSQLMSSMDELTSYQQESLTRTRTQSLFSIATYDAMACYTDHMEGLVVGDTLRRPKSERTEANMKVAMIYALNRVIRRAFPKTGGATVMDELFSVLNMNPNYTTTDVRTPVGLGNQIAHLIEASEYWDEFKPTKAVQNIGRNWRGGRSKISHWTPYVPKQDPYKLKYANKWQPLEVMVANEYPAVQVFIADIYSSKPMITGYHPSYFKCRRPTEMLYPKSKAYKAQADRVIHTSANLNDTLKMYAEGVDGAFGDDGVNFVINKWRMNFQQQVLWNFIFSQSVRESLIVSAYWKSVYDTIRPITLIRSTGLYDYIDAWAGPGLGTKKIRAIDFRQYNDRTDPSPEYPSGACTYYATYTGVAKRFLGTEEFGWTATFAAGTSRIEPGITPKKDVNIHFAKWSDLREGSMIGREAGLVHFRVAVTEAVDMGDHIAEKLYKKISSLFKMKTVV